MADLRAVPTDHDPRSAHELRDPTSAHELRDPTSAHELRDATSAHELRDAITATRRRLLDVLYARARTLSGIATWTGPHRARHDEDAAQLLAAGRALDASLGGLLQALDAELARSDGR